MSIRSFIFLLASASLAVSLTIYFGCDRRSTGDEWEWLEKVSLSSVISPTEDPSSLQEVGLKTAEVQGILEKTAYSEDTHVKVYRVKARMTACSPQDPNDKSYYKKHGWQGAAHNMCFDLNVIPKGSKVRITPEENEYMDVSFPGKFWDVDASGGSVIRRSTEKGIVHGDVKYRTLYSVRKFGNKPDTTLEVVFPRGYNPGGVFLQNVIEIVWLPKR